MEYYEKGEIKSREKINYKRILKLIKLLIFPYRAVFLKLLVFFSFATILRMSGPILIKHIIDYALAKKNLAYVINGAFLFLGINIVFFIVNYYSLVLLIKTGQKIIFELKNKIYYHILKFDIDYFSKNNPGKIAARIQSDTTSVYEIFSEFSITMFVDIIVFITIFSIMYYHSPSLTLIIFPMILIAFVIIFVFVKKSQMIFVEVRRKIAELTSFLSEFLNIHSIVKIYRSEDKVREKFEKLNFDKFLKTISAEYIAIFFFLSVMLFDPISKSIIFGYGGLKVLDNQLTVGTIVMFILYIGQLFEPIFRFSEYVGIIQKSFAALERVNRILEITPKIVSGKKFIDSFDYIEFIDVWMKYPESDWILKNLSFRLEKGKTLAIVGRTGEGKTTIANVIFRFYDYQKGKILINGMNLKELNVESLRKKIGLVQQDIYLFPVSLKDNLRLMDDEISEEKIYYAIETLNLSNFYKKYPLNMEIKEKGKNLSAGEKQIISLTRALVLDQDLIILDEATSNVDPYTENLITSAIKNIMKHKTLIVIAHRLTTIINSDYIGFLKDGKFIEFGTHHELLNLKREYYSYFVCNF
ncbi:MAG: ABC transporter ATP-binding protein/permease [Candidatus Goldbacteria bacterium]|nr:ABC transporter ATP-binding protein/permease [Candidatus Goldiibacteriota bacterium]